jgi:hypothetical protein
MKTACSIDEYSNAYSTFFLTIPRGKLPSAAVVSHHNGFQALLHRGMHGVQKHNQQKPTLNPHVRLISFDHVRVFRL